MASATASAVSYLDFLAILAKLGSNLGPAIALIKAAVEDFQAGYAKLQKLADLLVPKPADASGPVALTVASVDGVEITAEVLEAENHLLALSRQNGLHVSKLGDGTLLRPVFQFMKEHPEVMGAVLRMLLGLSGLPSA